MTSRNENWHGQKWIRNEKRLAIYLRDGLACAYCGATVENGAVLTLDHLRPHSKNGTNNATNLVTCCKKCNSSRGNRSLRGFCRAVAQYVNHGITAKKVEQYVKNCARRALPLDEAKSLINRQGGFSAALRARE